MLDLTGNRLHSVDSIITFGLVTDPYSISPWLAGCKIMRLAISTSIKLPILLFSGQIVFHSRWLVKMVNGLLAQVVEGWGFG